jgi:hypothetical protein
MIDWIHFNPESQESSQSRVLAGSGPENKNFLQPCDFGSAQLNLVKFRNTATSAITIRRPIPAPPQKSISRENGFLEGSR